MGLLPSARIARLQRQREDKSINKIQEFSLKISSKHKVRNVTKKGPIDFKSIHHCEDAVWDAKTKNEKHKMKRVKCLKFVL